MLVKFIALFAIFTASYWIGYLFCKFEMDKRPVCFLFYGNGDPVQLECFFGYFEQPYCNAGHMLMKIKSDDGTVMHFVLSKDELIRNANGRRINLVVNVAHHSWYNNERYMNRIFLNGTRIVVEHTDVETTLHDD